MINLKECAIEFHAILILRYQKQCPGFFILFDAFQAVFILIEETGKLSFVFCFVCFFKTIFTENIIFKDMKISFPKSCFVLL